MKRSVYTFNYKYYKKINSSKALSKYLNNLKTIKNAITNYNINFINPVRTKI